MPILKQLWFSWAISMRVRLITADCPARFLRYRTSHAHLPREALMRVTQLYELFRSRSCHAHAIVIECDLGIDAMNTL
jgi:hypothetical protein